MAIWRQQFNNQDLTLDDNYFEMGGDSLMAIGMIVEIEKAFGNLIQRRSASNSPKQYTAAR